jgi:hypothetical protein
MSTGRHRKETRKPYWRSGAIILAIFALVTGALGLGFQPTNASAASPTPVKAAFMYDWFPETWHSTDKFHPSLGQYSSDNSTVAASQMAAMHYAGLDAAIVSWWGQGQHKEDTRFPLLFQTAQAAGMKIAPYYEPEGQSTPPSASQLASDLNYLAGYAAQYPDAFLKVNGKPVIFVYNATAGVSTCSETSRWLPAQTNWYVDLKVFSGYASCANQPDSWHQYGPASDYQKHGAYSAVVSPGFWRYDEATPRLARDLSRFQVDLTKQATSGAAWWLITTWNEWGEGTAVEPAAEWPSPSGWGAYVDAMRSVYVDGARYGGGTPTPTPSTSSTGTPSPTPSVTPTGSPTGTPTGTPTPSPTTPIPTTTTTTPTTTPTPTPTLTIGGLPSYDHIVVVVFENHSQTQILGNSAAPWFNTTAANGALLTSSVGVAHPSLPNYLAMYSGSTQGVTDDGCSYSFTTPSLGQQLAAAGVSFAGYAENLPSAGSTTCTASGGYAKKHAPWAYWPSDAQYGTPYSAWPSDPSTLPKVSFVIPNLCDDMHDCSVATGDTWASTHLQPYLTWAKTHNSLLVVTFDENDGSSGNKIATFFAGAHVATGLYSEAFNHYRLLRTVEGLVGCPGIGSAASLTPVTDIWN